MRIIFLNLLLPLMSFQQFNYDCSIYGENFNFVDFQKYQTHHTNKCLLDVSLTNCKGVPLFDILWLSLLSHDMSKLVISNNDVETILNNCSKKMELLKCLILSKNKIKSINLNQFISMPNLEYLDLSDNNLIEIKGNVFNLKNLETYYLTKFYCSYFLEIQMELCRNLNQKKLKLTPASVTDTLSLCNIDDYYYLKIHDQYICCLDDLQDIID